VYIKQLELTNFKSFGSTTAIPLLPGFTVVSGPNGSGKSNLLDALLFALGLAGSKGMRAERLPDLVNHSQSRRSGSVVETRVTVVFDLEGTSIAPVDDEPKLKSDTFDDQPDAEEPPADAPPDPELEAAAIAEPESPELESPTEAGDNANELRVTRKLRVTKQGTYTSTYYINDIPCTLNELHEQLNRLRIYPEGYNVVLQGDVTGIISMNPRQRREIIDELAGVADFDRKINQARDKLDTVKEREDRFRIVEAELIEQRDRLSRDRIQAEKYQKLRTEFQTKEKWEGLLVWRDGQKQLQKLEQQVQASEQTQVGLRQQLDAGTQSIQSANRELERLNAQVKALGEEELLKLQSSQAGQEAELRQLERQQQELQTQQAQLVTQLNQTQTEMTTWLGELDELAQTQQTLEAETLLQRQQQRDQAQTELANRRSRATSLASAADDWVQEQTKLRQQIEELLKTLDPQRSEQARLLERCSQLEKQAQDQTTEVNQLRQELTDKQALFAQTETEVTDQTARIQGLAEATAGADQDYKILVETQARLVREQQEKQRQLDKLETQQQIQQEVQGTGALKILEKAKLKGLCGIVAQLGRVEPEYQTALEIAAGARMGNIVVEDDQGGANGIEILKRERGGRATFLPLNKIQASRNIGPLKGVPGAIDYALNLIEFDQRFLNIFAYVLGNTVVFANLQEARRYLGQYRMVTLDGELLEQTGAMTGGSRPQQQSLHFGTAEAAESHEVIELRERLAEIDHLLQKLNQRLEKGQTLFQHQGQALTEARQQQREAELRLGQIQTELQSLQAREAKLAAQLQETNQELNQAQNRLQTLEANLPQQEAQLAEWRLALANLEESQSHSEWQQLQQLIQAQEAELNLRDQELRAAQEQLLGLENQRQRLQEKIQQAQTSLQTLRQQQQANSQQQQANSQSQTQFQASIAELKTQLAAIEQKLGAEKQARDQQEAQVRQLQTAQQQLEWQLQKQQETQVELRQQIGELQAQLHEQSKDWQEPLPEIPEDLTLEQLRNELRSLQKRMQAMEPVNMLAIEEYDRTQARLNELTEKLETLEQERTELLLRIENFTTLRHQAFREAFDAVNANFQTIFAELSDGDGFLQLENAEDPFQGGLNLVAHPKGKPVQRLASMSGGEKSLTALSFIFALQRYRPSPFYSFDEVDMFLDGANVEKLSKMIQKQALGAQFIVVSLRRPMIEAAQRTIGVTQARGTHTQVIGLQLRPTVTVAGHG
jgi:chromosome segregation protein